MSVRVRFAPSPTGYLHIGGARTALFNWLYARRAGGTLILRIEDTDADRSSGEMAEGILEGLRWLGLDWDEGPYFQSQRLDLYHSLCQRLLQDGHAYQCFCSPQLLADKKQQAPQDGRDWQYDGACRRLSESEREGRLQADRPFAVRFKVPRERRVSFQDLVYGKVEVESANIEDFVILRSDGGPTYHLSVVADDTEMRISHVLRGADHLSNTHKHVLLYEALGESLPVYAHLPLILGADKKRLSKRHGATSVLEYREQGFLPSALKSYLVRFGWSSGDDQEIFSEKELIELFDLERVNKTNAVFDHQKLEWMNGQHVSLLPAQQLATDVKAVLKSSGLWDPGWESGRKQQFLNTIDLLKPRVRIIPDFVVNGAAFFSDKFDYEATAQKKYLAPSDPAETAILRDAVQALHQGYGDLSPFDLTTTERVLRGVGEKYGIKAGKLIGAVRVALTGQAVAPGIFDVIVTLGKEKTRERLSRLLAVLK